jgi:hypothetical protein
MAYCTRDKSNNFRLVGIIIVIIEVIMVVVLRARIYELLMICSELPLSKYRDIKIKSIMRFSKM